MKQEIQLRTGEAIPLSAVEFATSRSGGPGGQHANKVETKVEARLSLAERPELRPRTLATLRKQLDDKLDKRGVLHITSSSERSQYGNRVAVIRKLQELLDEALKPRKRRVRTKPTLGSKRRRDEKKKKRSETKVLRQKPDH